MLEEDKKLLETSLDKYVNHPAHFIIAFLDAGEARVEHLRMNPIHSAKVKKTKPISKSAYQSRRLQVFQLI